ncbi:MAG: hypothetical protein KU37_05880 [Sulfuricurvum sp. PC08-66]|nr:MAG: hypothetical protein KU37_05880 [Sulfuricurvum sp. PC08-66]
MRKMLLLSLLIATAHSGDIASYTSPQRIANPALLEYAPARAAWVSATYAQERTSIDGVAREYTYDTAIEGAALLREANTTFLAQVNETLRGAYGDAFRPSLGELGAAQGGVKIAASTSTWGVAWGVGAGYSREAMFTLDSPFSFFMGRYTPFSYAQAWELQAGVYTRWGIVEMGAHAGAAYASSDAVVGAWERFFALGIGVSQEAWSLQLDATYVPQTLVKSTQTLIADHYAPRQIAWATSYFGHTPWGDVGAKLSWGVERPYEVGEVSKNAQELFVQLPILTWGHLYGSATQERQTLLTQEVSQLYVRVLWSSAFGKKELKPYP